MGNLAVWMQRHRVWLWRVVGVLAALAVIAASVLPTVERLAIRAPMRNGLAALRDGDIDGLRAVFAPSATIGVKAMSMSANDVIDLAEPAIQRYLVNEKIVFGGFLNEQRRTSRKFEADFYVYYYMEGGGLLPYRHVPVRKDAHVVMRRDGWFTWKIDHLQVDDPDLAAALTKAGIKAIFGF